MTRPSLPMAVSGTRRFPFGSRMTNIPAHLDAVAPVEVEHHVQRRPSVAAEHVHQGGPLPRGDRGERVREELLATETAPLLVKVASQVWLALIVKHLKLGRVGLPLAGRGVNVI